MLSRQPPSLLAAFEFPPNASGGGPAVVRQLLRDWPAGDLHWWSCLPEGDGRFGQRVSGLSCAGLPAKLLPQVRFTGIKSALLATVWAPWAAAHLRRTIRQVRPDAIWVIPHNWSILPLAAVLPRTRIGFHVTMHDYVDVHGHEKQFGPERCRWMAGLADRIYASATTRDAISHAMIADLRSRTQAAAAQMCHAGLEKEDFDVLENKSASAVNEVRIAYAGTILAPDAFALFVEAVRRLRASLPRPVSLHLFGAHLYAGARWFDAAWMVEHGNLPQQELVTALRDCTWGFVPMALTDDDPRYNRFSFPTKFTTYVTAGLPLITLGHPESSVLQMAARYGVGVATSETDVSALCEVLRAPLSDPMPWAHYADEIKRCAREEFDARRMRAVLYGCFERCAEATRSLASSVTKRRR